MSLPKPASCKTCPLWQDGMGFVPASDSGRNGVLVVLEAAGEDEAREGTPTVGKAGYYLWDGLKRAGLEREDFRVHNVLSCRPPENKLAGMWYEAEAVAHCAPFLDQTIEESRAIALREGKDFTILALGVSAFMRVMGIKRGDPILKEDYRNYVHRSDRHACWVIAGDHPSHLMRGNHHLLPVLQFAALRAVEVAKGGFEYAAPKLLLDPSPLEFKAWVNGYFEALESGRPTRLSVDIETPMKAKKGEEQLIREDDEDYIILRVSFSWDTSPEGVAVSIPWRMEYLGEVERLLGEPRNQLVGWNLAYDIPRLKNQLDVRGDVCDGMLWWHVLNSALEKGLGFVTPFYWRNAEMWKHLSGSEPALYNALDALAALINVEGIEADLRRAGQWEVVDRHVIRLQRCLEYMSRQGIGRDEVARQAAEERLTMLLDGIEAEMLAAVPPEARRLKVFKKAPKSTEGLIPVERQIEVLLCERCGAIGPKADHFKSIGKKKLKAGLEENPCLGAGKIKDRRIQPVWAKALPWKPSSVGLQGYQAALKQQAIKNRQKGTITFDDDALKVLIRKYPNDPLYPLIRDHREGQKILGTYVGATQPDGKLRGGLRIGKDGLIHPEFTMNPSTLRLACQNPNMQNLPRVGKADDLQTIVRNLIIARFGNILLERDFGGIEAVLSAYFARWKDGIRLAKLGVHSYVACHVLGRKVDLSWSDSDLKALFKTIKESPDVEIQRIYTSCKRAVHLSNYGGTPAKMVQAEPEAFPDQKYASYIQGVYFEVAQPIRKWQLETQLEAHQNGFLRNPFNYIHRFTHVFRNVKEAGKWVRKPGEEANEVLAFLPQSTAAGIIKEAMISLFENFFDQVGQYLRLQVHDSLVLDVPREQWEEVDMILKAEMEKEVEVLPLPASWEMGPFLRIGTDRKMGERWGACK